MGKFFNLDSPFVQFMNRVADLMWLNILFVLCSIPVITIGASLTAMYYVTLKMVRNEEAYISKSFFRSFKQNFVQATLIWLIILAAGGLLGLDYYIMSSGVKLSLGGDTFATVMRVLLITVSIFYVFTFTFIFPLLSKFDNTIKNTFKNAFIMSIRHFPTTLAAIAIGLVVAVFMIYVPIMLMFSMILLFSIAAYASSFLFVKVFDNYIPKEEAASDIHTTEESVTEESSLSEASTGNTVEEKL